MNVDSQAVRAWPNLTLRWIVTVVLIAATAWVGLASGRGAGHVPAVWWANSLLLAIILLSPRNQRLPLVTAGFYGNLSVDSATASPLAFELATALLAAADAALYRAKRPGRDRVESGDKLPIGVPVA